MILEGLRYFRGGFEHPNPPPSVRHRDGTSSVLILLTSCQQTCMYRCVYSENSWWRTEELSETCRVLFQK